MYDKSGFMRDISYANPKFQDPKSKQISVSKFQKFFRDRILVFVIWDLFGIWVVEFGINMILYQNSCC